MIKLIVGDKGKGKTKYLIDRVNNEVKTVSGSIVYLDKSSKHMYELNNKIRMISVADYLIDTSEEFLGFICGICSQDHDLEQMYLDSFLKIAHLENEDMLPVIEKLEKISKKFNVEFVLSVSKDEADLPKSDVMDIIVSL